MKEENRINALDSRKEEMGNAKLAIFDDVKQRYLQEIEEKK